MSDAATDPLLAAIDALADAAIGTDDLVVTTAETLGLEGLAELAGKFHDLAQLIKYMCDTVGAEILAIDWVGGTDDPYRIPTGGQLIRRTRAKRQNFDQDMVIGAIKSRLSEHLCSAEADSTPVGVLTVSGERVPVIALVDPVVDAMVAFTGAGTKSFNSWRATPAKALGINLSGYSEWSDGDAYISVENRNAVVRAGEAVLAAD